MKTRALTAVLSLLAISGFVYGYYLLNIYSCGYSVFCFNLTTKAFALYYGMPALAAVFLALTIFPRTIKSWWKKFAVWYIPLAVILFIFYTGPTSGDLFSPAPEVVFKWVSGIYVVVSLLIIVLKYWQLRKK